MSNQLRQAAQAVIDCWDGDIKSPAEIQAMDDLMRRLRLALDYDAAASAGGLAKLRNALKEARNCVNWVVWGEVPECGDPPRVSETLQMIDETLSSEHVAAPADGVDERASFEAWAVSDAADLSITKVRNDDLGIEAYASTTTFKAWCAWYARAGLAALARATEPGIVTLPTPITEDMHVAACKVLVRASGLDGLPQRMLNAMAGASPTDKRKP